MKHCRIQPLLIIPVLITILFINDTEAKKPISANAILKNVQSGLDSVSDYSANVNIAVDIPRLRMPNKEMQIYYKRPDKFAVQGSGFAIVPKIGFLPTQMDFLSDKVTVELRGTPDQNEGSSYILNLRSAESSVDMVTTLWIHPQRWTLEKVLVNAPEIGESLINIKYKDIDGIWLPETTMVYLNLERSIPDMRRPTVEHPVGFSGKKSGNEPTSGKISILFKDYRLNQGLSDELFEE